MIARTMGTREAGFTLLEVLVALVVLGVIVAGLAQGVRFGTVALDAQERSVAAGGDLGAVDRGLRRLLAGMDPVGDPLGDGTSPPLVGTADSATFAAELPDAAGGLETRRAAMRLLVRDGRLVLVWTPDPHATPLTPVLPVTTEMLPGVQGLEFAYFGTAGGDRRLDWQRSWSAPALPLLVRLRLVFPRGDARRWADIVAAPRRVAPP